jgi:hypothetical protein
MEIVKHRASDYSPFLNAKMKLLPLVVVFIVSGCIQEIELKTGDIEPKLVANSLFTSGKLSIQLSNSTALTQNNFLEISNALVVVSKGSVDQILDTLQFTSGNTYVSDIDLNETNTSYFLSVKAPGLAPLEAESYLPSSADVGVAYYRFPAGYDINGDPYLEVVVEINDSDEDDFYELFIFDTWNDDTYYRTNNFVVENDPVIVAEGLEDYKNTSFLFSDKLFNGKRYTLRLKFENASASGPLLEGSGVLEDKTTYIALRSLSKEYYQYRKSWVSHRYHQQSKPAIISNDVILSDLVDFLFKGETEPFKSNITNGYGVFAGYDQKIIKLVKRD